MPVDAGVVNTVDAALAAACSLESLIASRKAAEDTGELFVVDGLEVEPDVGRSCHGRLDASS